MFRTQPIKPQLAHGLGELIEVDRLANIAVDAVLVCGSQIPFFRRGRENDDGQRPGSLVSAYNFQDLDTVDFRKIDIEENHLGLDARVSAFIDRKSVV